MWKQHTKCLSVYVKQPLLDLNGEARNNSSWLVQHLISTDGQIHLDENSTEEHWSSTVDQTGQQAFTKRSSLR